MRQWRKSFEGTGEVLVLIEDVSGLADPETYDAVRARIPRFRQKKADSLLFERDRRLSVGAWLLLDQAFRMEGLCLCDYPIKFSVQGKPYAEDCPLRFNVSHSGEYVMCALSRAGEVGCDIQQLDAYDAGLARACMTPGELEEIETPPLVSQRACVFYRHWVAKESYVKALGCGLAKAPSSFAVGFRGDGESDSSGGVRIFDDSLTGEANVFEVPAPEGYCAAVCVLGQPMFFVRHRPA